MSNVTAKQPMTTEKFLALPENGVDRELIRGESSETPEIG